MANEGKKIVLAASNSESSEYRRSTRRQMLLATLPSRYLRLPLIDTDWSILFVTEDLFLMFIGFETGPVRLFKQYMKGKAYPYLPEQWPDLILKRMGYLDRWPWATRAWLLVPATILEEIRYRDRCGMRSLGMTPRQLCEEVVY